MKDKILVFLTVCVVILFFVVICIFYQNKALKAEKNSLAVEKNALSEDVLRYKQSLEEKEKQNEVLLEAKKEYEQFKQDLSNDSAGNLDISPSAYILDRMRKD